MTTSTLFDAHYYATGCGMPYKRDDAWLAFFAGVATQITAGIAPKTVLDAGCAIGLLVEQLHVQGVDAEGIDISEYAISQAHQSIQPYVRVGSIAEPFGKRYDLIVCIEVVEHMPVAEAEAAIANFCAHTDDVLFSSSPLDYKEATHFTVRPVEHWAELFARQGFYRDIDFDARFLTPWAVRFRRRSEPMARLVREYERRHWELTHENSDLRQLALEQRAQIAGAAQAAEMVQAQHTYIAHLEAQLQAAAAQSAYLTDLEAQIQAKNTQIARLEELLRRIEHGRLMRILRAFQRR
jgi:SAM-dependent methyltransferase